MTKYICEHCKKELEESETYEYRGAHSCAEHFDLVEKGRNRQRAVIMETEKRKTDVFRGLDLGDSTIGMANREILKRQIEVASKECAEIRHYERPNHNKSNKKVEE